MTTSGPRLIVVYAGYGDTLLLEYDDEKNPGKKGYWLIDGGPLTPRPFITPWSPMETGEITSGKRKHAQKIDLAPNITAGANTYQAYYQFLQHTLLRFCSSKADGHIDLLKGITATHPHADHIDGIIQLIADYIPDSHTHYKLDFSGPIIVNDDFRPGPRVKARHGALWNLLKDDKRNFQSKRIAKSREIPNDDSIPPAMSNICQGISIWKLWRGTGKSEDADKDDKGKVTTSHLTFSVDHSEWNPYSIITEWRDGRHRIITTGDSIGQKISNSAIQFNRRHHSHNLTDKIDAQKPNQSGAPNHTSPPLGIFKVPHHGSRRNSQLKDLDQGNVRLDEKRRYCLLCYVCWFFSTMRREIEKMEKTITRLEPRRRKLTSEEKMKLDEYIKDTKELRRNYGIVIDSPENQSIVQEIEASVMESFEADWTRTYFPEDPNQAKEKFVEAMDFLANQLRNYLRKFEWNGQKLDTPDRRWKFAVELVSYHNSYVGTSYIDPKDTGSWRKGNLGLVKRTDPRNPRSGITEFDFDDFLNSKELKKAAEKEYPKSTSGPTPSKHSGGSNLPAFLQGLHKALFHDPGEIVRFRQGILEFYQKFRQVALHKLEGDSGGLLCHSATNYVISSNGEYGHPNSDTVAAIMAAAIERGKKAEAAGLSAENKPKKCRIFVTTGAALRLSDIIRITKYLLVKSSNKQSMKTQKLPIEELEKGLLKGRLGKQVPSEKLWKQWVELWYLKDDYCAAIPTDDTKVEGCERIVFEKLVDDQSSLQQLKKEFNQSSAYDIPRANESKYSTFRLLITDPNAKDAVIVGSKSGFAYKKTKNPPNSHFRLIKKDIDIKSNRRIFELDGIDQAPMILSEVLPSERMVAVNRAKSGTLFRIKNKGNEMETLCYEESGGSDLEFRNESKQGWMVEVRIERVTGFPPVRSPAASSKLLPQPIPSTSGTQPSSATLSKPEYRGIPSVKHGSSSNVLQSLLDSEPDQNPQITFLSATTARLPPFSSHEAFGFDLPPGPITLDGCNLSSGEPEPGNEPTLAECDDTSVRVPFATWWNDKKSTNHSPDNSLSNVVHVVLGSTLAQAVLSEISSAQTGSTLAAIFNSRVDTSDKRLVYGTIPTSVTCTLILDSPPPLPDFGLGPATVILALATISAEPASLKLDLTTESPNNGFFSFIFRAKRSLPLYLYDIGYQGDMSHLDVASLVASIVGPDVLWSFFSDLPTMLRSIISRSLQQSSVDPLKTEIIYDLDPFGPEVQSATIVMKLSESSINLDAILECFNLFSCVGASFVITSRGKESFDIVLNCQVNVTINEKTLPFTLSASLNELEPVVLDFVVGNPTSPSGILEFFGLGPLPSLPLNGYSPEFDVDAKTIGFTLSQPFAGSHGELELTNIYFSISDSSQAQGQREACLSKLHDLLPEIILSKSGLLSDWSLKVAILNPKSSPSIGLQLDFGIKIKDDCSNLRLQALHWPVKGLAGTYRTSVRFQVDESSELAPPTITDILAKVTGKPSKNITDSIPVLGPILERTSITHGSTAVDGREVSGFSLSAHISDWKIASKPLIKVDTGYLNVDYNGTWWSGRLSTEIIFEDKFRCAAEFVLPSEGMTGGISIQNLSDEFTLGNLVRLIDNRAKLSDVPIMGNEDLDSLRLDKACLEVFCSGEKISISGFEISLDWGAKDIGHMKTFGNRLSIGMYEGPPENLISPIVASETADTEKLRTDRGEDPGAAYTGKTWFLRWEGEISNDWHLSASLEYSTVKTNENEERAVILSGTIFNSEGSVRPSGLIDSWSGSDSTDSLWDKAMSKNIKGSFELQECTISATIGTKTSQFLCGAQVTWGENEQVSGVLLIDKHYPPESDPKWGFALALNVRDFRFTDLVSDSKLAKQIDDVFSIKWVSVLAFNNPGNMGLSRISELIGNAFSSDLAPSESSFLTDIDLNETTFDRRITQIQTQLQAADASNEEKPKFAHKAGLAILARFSFESAKPGSLADALNLVAKRKLTYVDLMGYFGKITQERPEAGNPVNDQSIVVFKASISSFKPLSSVEMKKVELTYVPRIPDSKTIANEFSLCAECAIDLENDLKWEIEATLVVNTEHATLTTSLAREPLRLLPGLQLSDIIFEVSYKFGGASTMPNGGNSDKQPGALSVTSTPKPSHSSSIDLSLKGLITLGSLTAEVSAVFESQKPGALLFEARKEWSISDLLNKIFDSNFPSDLLDIKFSNFLMYYAWKEMKRSSGNIKSFKKGLHAESGLDLFGVQFLLSININHGDKQTQGVTIAGEKSTPVKVLVLTLHGTNDKKKGPKFVFSTGPIKKCSISTGITLFDQTFADVFVEYNSKESRFSGSVTLPTEIAILGGMEIKFELKKKGDKNVLRIYKFPAAFDDLLKAHDIFKKVIDMKKDPCEVFVDELKKFVTTKFHVNLEIPEDHQGLAPEKGDEGVSELKLNLHPSVDIKIASHSIDNIVFGPLSLTIPTLKTLSIDTFAKSFLKILTDNVPQILNKLLTDDNIEKLAKILTVVAAEKLIAKAASKVICRNKHQKPNSPKDKPHPHQQTVNMPSTPGSLSLPGVPGLPGLLGLVAFGGLLGGPSGGLFGQLFEELFGGLLAGLLLIFAGFRERDKRPPSRPSSPTPDIPDHPEDDDPIGIILREAIEPTTKFTRWKTSEPFNEALKAARDCALEYWSAIQILGKVLGDDDVVSEMGNKTYTYYRYKFEKLQYDISILGKQFAEKWLDRSAYTITSTHHRSKMDLTLDISRESLGLEESMGAIVAIAINGEGREPRAFEPAQDIKFTVPLNETTRFTVTVKVAAFCAIRGSGTSNRGIGDESDFVFFSWGKPASKTIDIEMATQPQESSSSASATSVEQESVLVAASLDRRKPASEMIEIWMPRQPEGWSLPALATSVEQDSMLIVVSLDRLRGQFQKMSDMKDFPELSAFNVEWVGYNKRCVTLLAESRDVASSIADSPKDIGDLCGTSPDIQDDTDHKYIIEGLKDLLVQDEKDHEKAARMIQGFQTLQRDVENIFGRLITYTTTTRDSFNEEIKKLRETIENLDREISDLDNEIKIATLAFVTTAGLLFVLGATASAIALAERQSRRTGKIRERSGKQDELAEVERRRAGLSNPKTVINSLNMDIASIREKLVRFEEIWVTAHNQIVQLQLQLKHTINTASRILFRAEFRLAMSTSATLRGGLEQYVTGLKNLSE